MFFRIKKVMNKTDKYEVVIAAVLIMILAGYILLPSLKTLGNSFVYNGSFSLKHYHNFFINEINRRAALNTVLLGASTAIVCGGIGTLLAFGITFFRFPGKKIIKNLLLVPIMVPGVIIVLSFIQLYGESGMITKSIQSLLGLDSFPFKLRGFYGILFVHAYTQYVYFYINVSIAIKHIDYSAIEASRNLGAGSTMIFRTILYPVIKPALIASSLITFISGISSFSAPSLIGGRYRVLTTQMLFAKSNNNFESASVQVVLLTFISLTFLYICRYYENKSSIQWPVKGVPFKELYIKNKVKRRTFLVVMNLLIFLILLPVITILILSFVSPGTWLTEIYPREFSMDNYIRIVNRRNVLKPILNSINMSVISGAAGVLIALPCSYILVKGRSKLKNIIEVLTILPWAMPASAVAINLIYIFNQPSILSLGKNLTGSYVLLPMAYTIGVLPLVMKSINISMHNLNDSYSEASKSLGGSSLRTLLSITIPLVSPGIASGFLLAFVRSVGEYTSSAYLFTFSNRPISIAMVNAVFDYEIGLAMAYGVLVVCLVLILSLVSRYLMKNK